MFDLNAKLREYVSLANYIAAINGPNCEVILHDLSDLKHSIVHIVNGHITDRKVGGSITDYALELLQKGDYADQDYVANYIGSTKGGKTFLRSSTYFIRDDEGKAYGLLCINYDITELLRIRSSVDDLIMIGADTESLNHKENFDLSVDSLVDDIIQRLILQMGIKLTEASIDHKKELIKNMDEKGVFRFKGTVSTVAKLLNVSIQTIYRYLSEVSEE